MAVQLVVGEKVFEIDKTLTCNGRSFNVSNERIGSGGNSDVYPCQDAKSGEDLAIKFFRDRKDGPLRFEREIDVCLSIDHHHVIKGIGRGSISGKKGKKSSRDAEVRYFIMELADGDLMSYIKSQPQLLEEEYMGQFVGLSEGLGVLHQRGIHRDIKPENILLSGGRWLLADFGLFVPNDSDGSGERTEDEKPVPGPRNWMSPESILETTARSRVCAASDVYQLAAVFWYVVCRRYPLGVVTEADWYGPPFLFPPLVRALQHDASRRPRNGSEFALCLKDA
jgi:serine/threonine protein kinase